MTGKRLGMEILVRRLLSFELPWLKSLLVASSIYNIPHGRLVSNQTVREAQGHWLDEQLSESDSQVILVAENQDGFRLGALLLKIDDYSEATGEFQSNIVGLAIEPKAWSTKVHRSLLEEAAKVTAKLGRRYMVGQVSSDNRSLLMNAFKLGFEIDTYEISMACTLEGPAKSPTRPEHERAHDILRTQRKLLARRQARKLKRKKRKL